MIRITYPQPFRIHVVGQKNLGQPSGNLNPEYRISQRFDKIKRTNAKNEGWLSL